MHVIEKVVSAVETAYTNEHGEPISHQERQAQVKKETTESTLAKSLAWLQQSRAQFIEQVGAVKPEVSGEAHMWRHRAIIRVSRASVHLYLVCILYFNHKSPISSIRRGIKPVDYINSYKTTTVLFPMLCPCALEKGRYPAGRTGCVVAFNAV
jgi:hypothetical protein